MDQMKKLRDLLPALDLREAGALEYATVCRVHKKTQPMAMGTPVVIDDKTRWYYYLSTVGQFAVGSLPEDKDA